MSSLFKNVLKATDTVVQGGQAIQSLMGRAGGTARQRQTEEDSFEEFDFKDTQRPDYIESKFKKLSEEEINLLWEKAKNAASKEAQKVAFGSGIFKTFLSIILSFRYNEYELKKYEDIIVQCRENNITIEQWLENTIQIDDKKAEATFEAFEANEKLYNRFQFRKKLAKQLRKLNLKEYETTLEEELTEYYYDKFVIEAQENKVVVKTRKEIYSDLGFAIVMKIGNDSLASHLEDILNGLLKILSKSGKKKDKNGEEIPLTINERFAERLLQKTRFEDEDKTNKRSEYINNEQDDIEETEPIVVETESDFDIF